MHPEGAPLGVGQLAVLRPLLQGLLRVQRGCRHRRGPAGLALDVRQRLAGARQLRGRPEPARWALEVLHHPLKESPRF